MTTTKLKFGIIALAVAGAAMLWLAQHQTQAKLRAENGELRQQLAQPRTDAEPANQVATADEAKALPEDQMRELMRLRGEVGILRQQTNDLSARLANSRPVQAQAVTPAVEQRRSPAPPEEYPRTADGAAKGIFDTLLRGDWENFFANFGQPGVPRDHYDQMFLNPGVSNYLANIESMSLGQPTNGFGRNRWFVPYKIRFKDGTEKEWRLSVVQSPDTQRWYFDGGL